MNFWTDSTGRILSPFTAPWSLRPGGRLTLTSGLPVTTSDVTNATTVYYTPYVSNVITLWNGNAWQPIAFNEVSLLLQSIFQTRLTTTGVTNVPVNSPLIKSIPSTTGIQVGDMVDEHNSVFGGGCYVISVDSATQVTTNTSSNVGGTNTFYFNNPCYDIFGYLDTNNGLMLTTVGWASRTTRATALALTDGLLTLSTDKTRLYLGTIYLTSAYAGKFATNSYFTADSMLNRLVWNNYNRVVRPMFYQPSVGSWAYGAAAWRFANGYNGMASGGATSPLAAVNFVCGQSEDSASAEVLCPMNSSAGTAGNVALAIDTSLSAPAPTSVDSGNEVSTGEGGIIGVSDASCNRPFAAGYHYIGWLEYCRAGTLTMYGLAGPGNLGCMWGSIRA